ncbi:hypothetical protein C0J52_20901 [Blattella germanica]|nr:hypothetical protein C0J52_20901 [Blattella germanica]
MDTDCEHAVQNHVDSRHKPLGNRQCSLGELLYNALSGERSRISRKKERAISHVLVLFTGGTVGMIKSEHNGYIPKPNVFEKYIRKIPFMHDEEYANTHLIGTDKEKFLVHPEVVDKARILYRIKEYSPLLDSSNLGMDNWIRIGLDIKVRTNHLM